MIFGFAIENPAKTAYFLFLTVGLLPRLQIFRPIGANHPHVCFKSIMDVLSFLF